MPYRSLDPVKIIETARRLRLRVNERFAGAGLNGVADELVSIGETTAVDARALEAPIYWLRALVILVVAGGGGVFVFVGTFLSFDRISTGAFDVVQVAEASINTAVLAGIGLMTLLRLEERIKRRKVLQGLHKLRSLIHVIDMHQLTKDPAIFSSTFKPTENSPKRDLSRQDMSRYLDYCSEMLSITGKYAALYAQSVTDTVVIDAVNDVENLGTNLSRKIWQKIMINSDQQIGESRQRTPRKRATGT